MSNVHAREDFRRHSYITPVATGVVAGLGVEGYGLAVRFLAGRRTPVSAAARRLRPSTASRVGVSVVEHMKWWGWGQEGVAFHHEDKPNLAPFVKRVSGIDFDAAPAQVPQLSELTVPPSQAPDALRKAFVEAVGRGARPRRRPRPRRARLRQVDARPRPHPAR